MTAEKHKHSEKKSKARERLYVDTPTALEALATRLKKESTLAVDTESDGFYVYREKVCLIQISSSKSDVIVDPLAVDATPLSILFENPHIEKIFHAAEYDVLSLKRDYGFQIENIFDTMAAARQLGYKQVGLASLIQKHFGIKLDKKLQRADWGRRPLSQDHLDYARRDTEYLVELRGILSRELEDKGLAEDAQEEFNRLSSIVPNEKKFDRDGFWSIGGARKLDGTSARVLKEMWLWRDRKAEAMNRAPFRVMPEQLLLRLAQHPPTGRVTLRQLLTPYLLHRFGDEILAAVMKGLQAAPIEPPPAKKGVRWERRTMSRYEALRRWRRETAHDRGVEPDVILSTETLKNLAKKHPASLEELCDVLSPVHRRKYGEDVLAILAKPLKPKKG